MKSPILIHFKIIQVLLIIFLANFTLSCSKEKECDDPIDCLPSLTQTGDNTAGCLVNGKALVPGGQGISTGSVLFAQYHIAGDNSVFGIAITNRTSGGFKRTLIEVRNQKLIEGGIYELKSEGSNSFGSYNDLHLGGFVTSNEHRGELIISNIDMEKRIISGTFWFDAVDDVGETVEIRNGRFDVIYY